MCAAADGCRRVLVLCVVAKREAMAPGSSSQRVGSTTPTGGEGYGFFTCLSHGYATITPLRDLTLSLPADKL